MKQFSLFLVAAISYHAALAQWTTSGSTIYNTNSGNVGVGTTSPAYKLVVNTSNAGDGFMVRYNDTCFVWLHGPSIQSSWYNPITLTGDGGFTYGGSNIDVSTAGFVIAPWSATQGGIRLDNHGNVGINTNTTQGYQLAVNGSAIFTAARVKAYANWPDFVLAKGYRLPSLDSLSSFIQHNGHLPEIPSADSIAAAGIDLGGTDGALLKKIEELTLYLIEQNKTIAAQQKEIEALRAMVLGKKKHH